MLDWLGREGSGIFSWWLLSLLGSIAVYPLFFRLTRALPSRGYALARAAGLLLIGYLFWILNNLGLLQNTPGSTAFVWLIVIVLSAVSYLTWRDREPLLPWLRDHLTLILTTELLFAVLFLGWATIRALNPSLAGTEHPMDLAFLSASRRSSTFPPNDPWMSGYAISYYHYGYILMAMIANLSGVINGVAFNLSISLVFALAGVGAFGIGYDLVALRLQATRGEEMGKRLVFGTAIATGLLAMSFLVLMGNLGTALVEVPYQTKNLSADYLNFWDLKYRPADFKGCPQSGSADPATWNCGGWWWWAYSRVIQDRRLNGDGTEIIDEVPQFSYILSDLHPHVMALPFVMLTLALALNIVALKRRLQLWEFLLYGIFVGALLFLNSWDAIFLIVVIGAEALRRLINNGTGQYTREDWIGMTVFAVAFGVLCYALYLPFFIGFRSQVNGLLPNVIWPTRFSQYFLFFGAFLILFAIFLTVEARRGGKAMNWRLALDVLGWGFLMIVIATVIFGVFSLRNADTQSMVIGTVDESGGVMGTIPAIISRRIAGLPTELLLLAALAVVVARLFAREPLTEEGKPATDRQVITYSRSTGFVLLIIAAGAVLTLVPDFIYIQDGFGTRINMIFKLYYQTWALWSVAGVYALWSVLSSIEPIKLSSSARAGVGVLATVVIGAGMLFPYAAITSRAFVEGGHMVSDPSKEPPMTLDGASSLLSGNDEYNTIQCLNTIAKGDRDVVAEATRPGLAYNSQYGRVSALTGIPTLIGWDNHENQWRGKTFQDANVYYDPTGRINETRWDAIAKLYNTTDWAVAQDVIKRYGITYVFVGPTERTGRKQDNSVLFDAAGLAKFDALKPVCSSGDVDVYSVDSIGPAQTNSAGG